MEEGTMTTLSIPFSAYGGHNPLCVIGLESLQPPPTTNISSLTDYFQRYTPSPIDTTSLPKVGVSVDDREVPITISCSKEVNLRDMAWLQPTIRAMAQLQWLPEDWDSYGGHRVALRAIERMIETLLSTLSADAPFPAVVPTSQGGVQVEWHQNRIDLEIMADSSGALEFFYKDSERELEGAVEDTSVLSDLAQRLKAS